MSMFVISGCISIPKKDIDFIDEQELWSNTIKEVETSHLKKEIIEPLKFDNTNYCNVNKINRFCICQKGYVKLKKRIPIEEDRTFTCIPQTCSQVYGTTTIGGDMEADIVETNYELCIDAVNGEEVSLCDIIDYQQGVDLCKFAYVERTNDIKECGKIKDEYLKNECKK